MDGAIMQCPKCQFDNREGVKFCEECGVKFEIECPVCKANIPIGRKFCGECGYDLSSSPEADPIRKSEHDTQIPESSSDEIIPIRTPTEGERKHVTVLFSDLTGYTAMSEKLDPEDVKEITSRIFSGVAKIVANYDGFIEKYAGDAVMAIFGVPQVHEDDPVRAIKAAREIHQLVDAISPEIENRIGQSISMHTGINTGLVVTGEVDMQRGTHGIAGDTINLASRLSNLAKPGEILIDGDTCCQVEGQFECEYLETTSVKGKSDPVQVNKVLSQRDKPVTTRRLSGLRADLVGRKVEMAELAEAVENLQRGKSKIFSICGAAGTGKSRLIEEFKSGLDLEEIQWIEGHAYAYSQNIPYFPLVDLLNRVLGIEENDPPEKLKGKVESGIESLVGRQEDVTPYVGRLYSLKYSETEDVSPEYWKSRLHAAILTILSALSQRTPTVFFLEDLHWADPSFVELLRRACLEIRQPAIVLCAYRPNFSLFTGHQLSSIGKYYHEIKLQDLSLSEAHDMLESLLKSNSIPPDLKRWVQSKAEGNPFYLEELVNTLIESETLIQNSGSWQLARPITESDISPSLHGLISGRIDRLEPETRRILQEAAVIGRVFFYEILKRVTELEACIDRGLNNLERLDLIRTRTIQPDLEYMFKHALTQEVVYKGLLKKERKVVHERVGLIMEKVFKDRLPEFYETLAIHFSHGRSVNKALYYLMKSGEKNLKRYAVEESHQYYKEAFELLSTKSDKSDIENTILIDLLIQWAWVFHFRADYKGLTELLSSHKELAEAIGEKSKLGMFYAWLGFALFFASKLKDSYQYLGKALNIGEGAEDQQVTSYACAMLAGTCADLGLLDDAIAHGTRAQEISMHPDIYSMALHNLGRAYAFSGEWKKALETGKTLLSYGQQHSNSRSIVSGHWLIGYSYNTRGEFSTAIECAKEGLQVSMDPFFAQAIRVSLGIWCAMDNRLPEAEENLRKVKAFAEKFDAVMMGTQANLFLGAIMIAQGNMSQGLKMIENAKRTYFENHNRTFYALSEYVLGKVYLQIVVRSQAVKPITILKNIGFIIKHVPFAAQKAETHFNKAIELAKKMGAKGGLGMTYFDLGLLHKANKKTEKARECILEAIKIFEKLELERYLKQAEEALASLE